MIKQIQLRHQTSKGRVLQSTAMVEFKDGRIWFIKSPFALKDEIKAMQGSKWHGFEDPPKKLWSIADTPRNRFNLAYMMGEDVFAWFDRPLVRHDYTRPLMDHQKDLADAGLTYHYQIFAAEMGVGKSLSAQEVMERSGVNQWWWAGPKTSLPNMEREFRKWNMDPRVQVELMTYEGLVKRMNEWKLGDPIPQGFVGDEASRLKTPTSQRSKATQKLANMIREQYGYEGYVILMSGTPAPKTPMDWWSLCEIVWPGFLKEGSLKAMEQRLAFLVQEAVPGGQFVNKRIGWKDDEHKCAVCGEYADSDKHNGMGEDAHAYKRSSNEISFLYERLKGLALVKHKKDCLQLPEKRYRRIYCKPTPSLLRVAKAVVDSAVNTITGVTLLRELSDGFQYREKQDGTTRCTHCEDGKVGEWVNPENPQQTYQAVDMLDPELVARLEKREVTCPVCDGTGQMPKYVRITREIPCPKDAALKGLLEENEETGRLVVFAGFTGSVDRVTRICQQEGWDVVQCDGRGFRALTRDGQQLDTPPLDYWADMKNPRVVFVAHPESGGMSLTLTESRMAIYWSNSYKPEYRSQSEDRVHRIGADFNRGVTIVDLIHLPSDERVLEVIRSNRKIELMTMGAVMEGADWEEGKEGETEETTD